MTAMAQHIDFIGRLARRAGVAIVLAATGLVAPMAHAADPGASEWARTEQTSVRLVSATAAVGSSDSLRFGLQFTLKPGWKTYWRSAGDAGLPVTVDWTGSTNLANAAMAW